MWCDVCQLLSCVCLVKLLSFGFFRAYPLFKLNECDPPLYSNIQLLSQCGRHSTHFSPLGLTRQTSLNQTFTMASALKQYAHPPPLCLTHQTPLNRTLIMATALSNMPIPLPCDWLVKLLSIIHYGHRTKQYAHPPPLCSTHQTPLNHSLWPPHKAICPSPSFVFDSSNSSQSHTHCCHTIQSPEFSRHTNSQLDFTLQCKYISFIVAD